MSSNILAKTLPLFILAIFAFIPTAFAAPSITFKPTPDSQYKVYEGKDYIVSVDLQGFAFTTKLDLYLKGPLNSSMATERLLNSYEYSGNGTHEFIWNGKLDGKYATPGLYQLTVKGSDVCLYEANVLTTQFEVSPSTLLTPTSAPKTTDPGSQDYKIGVDLKTADKSCVELRVDEKSIKTYKDLTTGPQTLSVDLATEGADLKPGDHVWELYTDGPACGGTKELEKRLSSGHFQVLEETEPSSVACSAFKDVDPTSPDCPAIAYVKSIGAMTGFPDGTFRGESILQRDQVAKISLETFDLYSPGVDYCSGQPAFPDVPQTQWSYEYVCRGQQLGMITGYEGGIEKGLYIPERRVNRVEFLALILRNLKEAMPALTVNSYQDIQPGQWFSGFAAYAFNNSLFTGATLNPTQEVSRVEVARVLYKLFQLGKI